MTLMEVFCHFQGSLEKCPTTLARKTYYGLKLHKPGINGEISMAPATVADDVKWMYLYGHKRFNIVSFKDIFTF